LISIDGKDPLLKEVTDDNERERLIRELEKTNK
jgi:hypothetical protein